MKKLIIFTATWCQPCKQLKKNLEGATLPVDSVTYCDVENWKDMAKEYGVRSVPTMVLDDGNHIKTKIGVATAADVIKFCEA